MNVITRIIWFSVMTVLTDQAPLDTDELEFEIHFRDYVTFWIGDLIPENIEHLTRTYFEYLTALPMEARIDVCNKAKKFAGAALDSGTSPITNVPIKVYQIHRTVLECDTIPKSYVEPDYPGENNLWKIFVNNNDFIKTHTFEVKMVTSKPVSCSEAMKQDPLYIDMEKFEFEDFVQSTCSEDVLLEKSHLVVGIRNPHSFMQLCIAAKKRIEQRGSFPAPVLQNNDVKAPQMYDFKNMKRAALECPSLPVMYIYLKSPRENNDVQIVLVKGK